MKKLGKDGRDFLPMLAKGWRDDHKMVDMVLAKEPKLRSLLNEPEGLLKGFMLPLLAAAQACNLETAVVLLKHGALSNVLMTIKVGRNIFLP